ncbi:hypothetical protein KC19_1G165500 [Ceratodon purpureus]|uniref:Uncharacterized protein n=1 Tax=Ceratodon purpureus TaxID=3225 RepID=A0A8T0J8K9_CERPU|nr:hypothetical protein KC19_1G165500 [Ceratodon purpureus]
MGILAALRLLLFRFIFKNFFLRFQGFLKLEYPTRLKLKVWNPVAMQKWS